jgi:type IV pilus assembly protein PilM
LDIGTHSVKAVQMSKGGGRLRLERVGFSLVDRNQFNVDPAEAQATAVLEALRTIPLAQSQVHGAIPGQTVVIRYPRLADMPENQLADAIQAEAGQNIPYELSEVFLDWTLLDKVTEGDRTMAKVLLVAARYEVIESRVQIADAAQIQFAGLGVDSLALADAAEGCDFLRVGESVALINLGLSNTSIHFVKDGVSNFIRDVNWGGRELINAVSKGRRCEYDEAERALMEAPVPQPEAPPEPPPIPDEIDDLQVESVPSPGEAPPELGGMDEGLSPLDPLADELGGLDELAGMGASSEPALTSSSTPLDTAVAEKPVAEILHQPLTRLVSEIRRSFDYYEQQLYEHPVERLILSGGVADLPIMRDTLSDELGVPVEVADPTSSALILGSDAHMGRLPQQPAQFMVAIGLAARGVAEL